MAASTLQRVLRRIPSHLQQHQKLHMLQTRAFAIGHAAPSVAATADQSDTDAARGNNNKPTSARSVHKVRSIPKHFNLLAPVDDAGNAIALENARKSSNNQSNNSSNGSNGGVTTKPHEWRHRPSHYNAYRPENKKWWKQMDRVSFRKLLDECMAVGKVSSVLRKVMRKCNLFLFVCCCCALTDLCVPLFVCLFACSTWMSTRSWTTSGATRSSC